MNTVEGNSVRIAWTAAGESDPVVLVAGCGMVASVGLSF